MPTSEPDDLADLLRADTTAPNQPDSFFSALAAEAISSGAAQSRRGRTKRVAGARLAAVVAGATLIVSGGAMASAILLTGADAPSHGRVPNDPPSVNEGPAEPTDDPAAPGASQRSDNSEERSREQSPGDQDGRGRPQENRGDSADPGSDVAPGRSDDHPPQGNGNGLSNGNGQGNQPQTNGNNGQGQSLGPNSHADEHAEGNTDPQGNSDSRPAPQGNANGHQELPGQEGPVVAD